MMEGNTMDYTEAYPEAYEAVRNAWYAMRDIVDYGNKDKRLKEIDNSINVAFALFLEKDDVAETLKDVGRVLY